MFRLEYIPDNTTIPRGRVSSTARRGQKWWNLVAVGDVVLMANAVSGDPLGKAVIVAKELVTLEAAIENADHNHTAYNEAKLAAAGGGKDAASKVLLAELQAAYGDLRMDEPFTVLHILPLNEGPADAA